QEINIPKLGENLAEVLNHIKKLYEISGYNFENYKKIIFETDDMSVIILKLGEDSNIALFFKKEEEKELKITAIRRYITRIEELIDMDEGELIIQDIIAKEEEIKKLGENDHEKKEKIEKLKVELNFKNEGLTEEDKERISKEIYDLELESTNLKQEIDKIENEIEQLKEKIEKRHK
ncbi:MAG: hypothetical protein ACFFDX_15985, partial [Candidatus Odinarchaeota archaeon]